jgi:hypothetical protein
LSDQNRILSGVFSQGDYAHDDDPTLDQYINAKSPHMKCELNNVTFEMILDTGAQISMISEDLMESLQIDHRLDRSYQKDCYGVGTSQIIGVIFDCYVKIGPKTMIPLNLNVMKKCYENGGREQEARKYVALLGMDFLLKYRCTINIFERNLTVFYADKSSDVIPFLSDKEHGKYLVPRNIAMIEMKDQILKLKNSFSSKYLKLSQLLKKIVGNILNHPTDSKYRSINPKSKIFTQLLQNVFEQKALADFFSNLGFDYSTKTCRYLFKGNCEKLKYAKECLIKTL